MRPVRRSWYKIPRSQKTSLLRKICALKINRDLSGQQLTRKYFTSCERGAVIAHCWRNDIALPRTRRRARARMNGRKGSR